MLMSNNPLKPVEKVDKVYNSMDLPSIYPMHCTIGLTKSQTYKFENLYRKY
jgi:hypothetical protein